MHYRIVTSGAVVRRGRLLLIRRSRSDRTLRGYWEMPGGRREHGETSRAACGREVREETGLAVQVGALLDVYEYVIRNPGGVFDVTNLVFRCRLLNPRARVRVSHEHEALGWFTADEVGRLRPMTPETRQAAVRALA